MPTEVQKYLQTSGEKIIYSTDEIQERDSVLCGYWCLYYLLERQKGRSILQILHNTAFDPNDKSKFIIRYFKFALKKIYNVKYHIRYMKSYCVKQRKQTECVPGSERYEMKRTSPKKNGNDNDEMHLCRMW